jgi:hypothetical protein
MGIFCTAHITHNIATDSDGTRRAGAEVLAQSFDIAHVTIQVEDQGDPCTKEGLKTAQI